MVTIEELLDIVPNTPRKTLEKFLSPLNQTMEEYMVRSPTRQAMFLAQWAHESAGFTRLRENLNYSAEGLLKTFRKYFTDQEAKDYARKPEKIANRVYANRMGNGPEDSGDGWKYRGGGIPQLTGKDNYRACGQALGLDLITYPETLEKPLPACQAAGWFWKANGLNEIADCAGEDAFFLITKKINGGLNGIDDRLEFWDRAKEVLNVLT